MTEMDVLAVCGRVLIQIVTRGSGFVVITKSVKVASRGDLVLQIRS